MKNKFAALLKDIFKIFKMRLSRNATVREEGNKLAIDVGIRLLSILVILISCITAIIAFLSTITPPYGTVNLGLLIITIAAVWTAYPIYFPKPMIKHSLIIRCLICIILLPTIGGLNKSKYYAALTPAEKEEMVKQAEADRASLPARRELHIKELADAAKREKAEESRKKLLALAEEIDAKAAKINNIDQQNYYDKLGSPKLLYKCENSLYEKAIGAQEGTFNRLINHAESDCGPAGYEIIERDE